MFRLITARLHYCCSCLFSFIRCEVAGDPIQKGIETWNATNGSQTSLSQQCTCLNPYTAGGDSRPRAARQFSHSCDALEMKGLMGAEGPGTKEIQPSLQSMRDLARITTQVCGVIFTGFPLASKTSPASS